MLGSPAAAGATTGEQAGPSDTTVALLGASRLCPFRCSQQGSTRGETTLIQRDRQRLWDQMGDELSYLLPSPHLWDLVTLSTVALWSSTSTVGETYHPITCVPK